MTESYNTNIVTESIFSTEPIFWDCCIYFVECLSQSYEGSVEASVLKDQGQCLSWFLESHAPHDGKGMVQRLIVTVFILLLLFCFFAFCSSLRRVIYRSNM